MDREKLHELKCKICEKSFESDEILKRHIYDADQKKIKNHAIGRTALCTTRHWHY